MEFTFNNTSSATTDISLFFMNKEYYSNIIVYSKYDIAFFCVHNFVVNFDKLQGALKSEIVIAQQYYQWSTNACQLLALDFWVRQKIFIKA